MRIDRKKILSVFEVAKLKFIAAARRFNTAYTSLLALEKCVGHIFRLTDFFFVYSQFAPSHENHESSKTAPMTFFIQF